VARAPISVVIPTLNSADDLAPCLASLTEGLSAGLIREVIVTDGGSTDGTLALADHAGANVVSGAKSRGGQLRRGCADAKGDWLLILHADTQMGQGWTAAVLDHISGDADRAGYFRLAFRAHGLGARNVAAWANVRSRLFALPYGDQGLLIPTALYHQVGGFPEIALMEDVALVRRLRGRLTRVDATASTSADKYLRQGWIKRGGLNLLMLLRFLAGTDPEKLAREYAADKGA